MTPEKYRELGLTGEQVRDMYRLMVLARELDKRTWLLNRAGKIPFLVSCQGHEGAQVGAAAALEVGTDLLCPYYRDIAMVLAFGMTPTELMLSNFARAADPNSGGRQMPGHFGSRRLGILTGSSAVGTQITHAVGAALAARMRGETTVVMTCFGEGSGNQGEFHEAANFAGVHKLPVIFFCQNNRYAISVPLEKQVGGGSIAARGQGYGMPGVRVDGNDVLAVYETVRDAVLRARQGEGPTLVEAMTYRLVPHSSDDDDSTYRSREEVEAAKRDDPLLRFGRYLRNVGVMTEADQEALLQKTLAIVDAAVSEAEAAPSPAPESTLEHVYAATREEH